MGAAAGRRDGESREGNTIDRRPPSEESRQKPWLWLFCQEMACTEEFARELESCLRPEFEQAVGINLDRFVLVPPWLEPGEVCFEADGTSYVDTNLAGADNCHFPVSIAWRCPGRQRVRPADAGAGLEGLEAWWRALPVEALRDHYREPHSPPWPASPDFPFDIGRYSFAIDWQPFSWPDVWLEIETDRPVFPDSADRLAGRLEEVRLRWNRAAEAGADIGVIHILGTLNEVIGPRAMAINVDFGSAIPQALVAMFDGIEQAADSLGIVRVRCRGSAGGRFHLSSSLGK